MYRSNLEFIDRELAKKDRKIENLQDDISILEIESDLKKGSAKLALFTIAVIALSFFSIGFIFGQVSKTEVVYIVAGPVEIIDIEEEPPIITSKIADKATLPYFPLFKITRE